MPVQGLRAKKQLKDTTGESKLETPPTTSKSLEMLDKNPTNTSEEPAELKQLEVTETELITPRTVTLRGRGCCCAFRMGLASVALMAAMKIRNLVSPKGCNCKKGRREKLSTELQGRGKGTPLRIEALSLGTAEWNPITFINLQCFQALQNHQILFQGGEAKRAVLEKQVSLQPTLWTSDQCGDFSMRYGELTPSVVTTTNNTMSYIQSC